MNLVSEWVVTWARRQASGLGQPSQCDIMSDTEREVVFSATDSTFGAGISMITKLKRSLTSIQL